MSRKDPEFRDINSPEHTLDTALRPTRWDDYIGQDNIKRNLSILLQAAKERGDSPEHLLFYGPPGLGKTTLAHLISHELGCSIKITSGPAIEKVGDLASLLTNLNGGEILFIDEIHRLNKNIEEVLYPAMESGVLDIILGKGPSARTVQLELPHFTLVAATTRVASVSSPLRSRFSGGVFKLEFYQEQEIEKIVTRSAGLLETAIDEQAAREIAGRSRQTPRAANFLLKRCRDYAQVNKLPRLNRQCVEDTFSLLNIDGFGLSHTDRMILETIINKFNGGPVGVNTIAAALSEEYSTIEEFNEPYLLQVGLLERTPRGRIATPAAYQHLGVNGK